MAIGRERYGKRLRLHKRLTPDLFEKARFLQDYHADDGHQKKLLPLYATLEKRYDNCTHIGDKIPNLFLHLDVIAQDFPDAKIMFLLRDIKDVANSHEARRTRTLNNPKSKWPLWRDARNAVKEWNEGLQAMINLGDKLDHYIVDYDRLYTDDILLDEVANFLDIEPTQAMLSYWRDAATSRVEIDKKPRTNLTPDQLAYIEDNANLTAYRHLLNRV